MTRRSREEINALVDQHRLIPLFNPDDFDVSRQVLQAAYAGGVRLFECTNRSAKALEIFSLLVPFVAEHMPDLVLGAGTIMDTVAAEQFYKAGAQFIVSPVITAEVGSYCHKHNIFWCPGAFTLNEIVHAHDMGADLVKIFPANHAGGPPFVKAIMAPCPWLRLMPTGGVDGSETNLRSWFEAGVACVGIGSQLFTQALLSSGDYATLTKHTKSIVATIQNIPSRS